MSSADLGQETEVAQEDAELAATLERRLDSGYYGAMRTPLAQLVELATAALTGDLEYRQRICRQRRIDQPAIELRKQLGASDYKPADIGISWGILKRLVAAEQLASPKPAKAKSSVRHGGHHGTGRSGRSGGRGHASDGNRFGPARDDERRTPVHGKPKRTGPKAGPKRYGDTQPSRQKGPGKNRNGGRSQ